MQCARGNLYGGIRRIGKHAQPLQVGAYLLEQWKPLHLQFRCQRGEPGDVAAWPRQARYQLRRERIAGGCHDDRQLGGSLPRADRSGRAPGHDGINAKPDQFLRDAHMLFGVALGPAIFQPQVASLNIAQFAKTLPQALDRWVGKRRDDADRHRPRRRCRMSDARPRSRSAANERDELATAAHSITSSARASSVGGTSRPSAFAVLRLITNSNLVGCWTGRSPGFSPLRMRST